MGLELNLCCFQLVVESQVDEAAVGFRDITDRELKEIRRSLEELG